MRFLTAWLVLATAASAAPGDPGTPEHAKAADLVKQLGHPRYPVREAAAKQLVEMGGAAAAALREGQKSTDEEVRARSATLLPQAIALDWQRKADAWVADADGRQKHDLPLLAEYEKVVGKLDAGSRTLFADMVRTSGPLLDLEQRDPANTIKALAARCRLLLDTVRTKEKQWDAPLAEVAAILLVHARHKDWPPTDDRAAAPYSLIANPTIAAAIRDKDLGPPIRKLLIHWIETRPPGDTMSGLYFGLLSYRQPFAEGVPQVVRLVKTAVSPMVRVVALEALGRAGTDLSRKPLADFLTDTTLLYDDLGGEDARQQVRDAALAAVLNSREQKPTDFNLTGYFSMRLWFGGEAEAVSLTVYGFESAAARTKGFEKWTAETTKKK
jgi:hypothetical protein